VSKLALREADSCRWDLVSLGEVMLRLDPGDERIATTRHFRAWEGGGEYNVARGLRRCFGLRAAVVTALADNPVGHLIEDLMYQGGVDRAQLNWVPYDGIGRAVRNGLNFTERGFGVRAPLGCSDRGHSAASQMRPGEVDWEGIFGEEGSRWFHCGGIFAALSDTTAELTLEAVQAARRHGTIVSYDLNYRPSLWKSRPGLSRAVEINQRLVDHVDVLLGNEEDFSAGLGYELAAADPRMLKLDPQAYGTMLGEVLQRNPELLIVASTLRQARTSTINDWGAVCRTRTDTHIGPWMERLEIFDRVGGGDSFASGFVYGLMVGADIDRALGYGVAHGALAMTTPGDTSMATLPDVERLMAGGAARVLR
jgi:2-dehydro-3-deoxygluconokinase